MFVVLRAAKQKLVLCLARQLYMIIWNKINVCTGLICIVLRITLIVDIRFYVYILYVSYIFISP